MSKTAFVGPYRDTVTRCTHRSGAMLDAPRTYCKPMYESVKWFDKAIIAVSVSVLIAVGVMILGAM